MITKESAPTGTVVYLKSGSPGLTVDWTMRNDGLAPVIWFEGSRYQMDAFTPECLTLEKSAQQKD
jgi:uncharacterized protein YodC (DUF2158 family)